MNQHLNEDGQFQSDKYEWCPPDFFAIKLTDPIGQLCVLAYAELTEESGLAYALRERIRRINSGN